jgi:hypothetical protein
VNKGQSKGAYSLEDASILHKVCQFVAQNLSADAPATPAVPVASSQASLQEQDSDEDDLSTLSDPVPLRSGPNTV